jgi:hypothetical protein
MATTASITVPELPGKNTVEVLDENRSLVAENGAFTDRFDPWTVHLYRIKPANGTKPASY